MGEYFAYVTGVATLLAFVLQLKDVFPQHRDARKALLYVVSGMFLGSLLGNINKIDIKIATEVHPISALVVAFLCLLLLGLAAIAIASVTSETFDRRSELYGLLGIGTMVFFVGLLAAGISFSATSRESPEIWRFSVQEHVVLARYHVQRKDFDRALTLLDRVRTQYPVDDVRRKEIESQIESIQKMMASDFSGK
jgi:MFS family permease